MSSKNNGNKDDNYNSIEAAVITLYEELQLATRWQRPSILLVTCHSNLLKIDAQISLEKKLRRIKQKVSILSVDENNFDIPLKLSRIPNRKNIIFFVSGLSHGGGPTGLNAYRALNIRRELLVDHNIRTVFWLNEEEADVLPRHALDFWSFRHRTVDLQSLPTPEQITELTKRLSYPHWNLQKLCEEIPTGLQFRQELLAELPDWEETPSIQAELLLSLAGLLWAKGEYPEAQKVLQQGLGIAQKQLSESLQSRYWNAIGLIHESLNKTEQAFDAFRRSLALEPASADAWGNLGKLYRDQHLPKEAIQATNKSIELDPTIPGSWKNLGNLYLDSGQFEQAVKAFEKSIAFNNKDPQTWFKLGDALSSLGKPAEAIHPLLKAKNLNIKDDSTWLHLGLAYLKLGLLNKAIRAFYKSARLNPLNTAPWKNLGDIYRSNSQLRYARKAYRIARSLDPNDDMVKYSLDACYIRRRK